jgi:D-threo-aldose 1-dehydrogenase
MFRDISDQEAEATVDAAWDHGPRFFDTAPMYGVDKTHQYRRDALYELCSHALQPPTGTEPIPASPPDSNVRWFLKFMSYRKPI